MWYVYIYIYINVYNIYIHMNIYGMILVYTHIHTYTHTHTYMHACMHAYIHTYDTYCICLACQIWLLELGWGGQEVRNLRSPAAYHTDRVAQKAWGTGRMVVLTTQVKATEAWLTGGFWATRTWDLVDNWSLVEVLFRLCCPIYWRWSEASRRGDHHQPTFGFVQEVFLTLFMWFVDFQFFIA